MKYRYRPVTRLPVTFLFIVIPIVLVVLYLAFYLNSANYRLTTAIKTNIHKYASSQDSIFVLTSNQTANNLTYLPVSKSNKYAVLTAFNNNSYPKLIDLTKIFLPKLIFYQPTLLPSSSDFNRFLKNYYHPVRVLGPIIVFRLRG